jgi:hypothetical protein
MGQVFVESCKHGRQQPNITRKQLQEYSYNLAHICLPKELEGYLIELYNEEDFLDTEGNIQNYSEQDVWFGVRKSILEYAQIKKKMDDLLGASEYLGNRSLTIKVQNKPEFLRWSKISEQQTILDGSSDDIPF